MNLAAVTSWSKRFTFLLVVLLAIDGFLFLMAILRIPSITSHALVPYASNLPLAKGLWIFVRIICLCFVAYGILMAVNKRNEAFTMFTLFYGFSKFIFGIGFLASALGAENTSFENRASAIGLEGSWHLIGSLISLSYFASIYWVSRNYQSWLTEQKFEYESTSSIKKTEQDVYLCPKCERRIPMPGKCIFCGSKRSA